MIVYAFTQKYIIQSIAWLVIERPYVIVLRVAIKLNYLSARFSKL
jgi:hypothetical protein